MLNKTANLAAEEFTVMPAAFSFFCVSRLDNRLHIYIDITSWRKLTLFRSTRVMGTAWDWRSVRSSLLGLGDRLV